MILSTRATIPPVAIIISSRILFCFMTFQLVDTSGLDCELAEWIKFETWSSHNLTSFTIIFSSCWSSNSKDIKIISFFSVCQMMPVKEKLSRIGGKMSYLDMPVIICPDITCPNWHVSICTDMRFPMNNLSLLKRWIQGFPENLSQMLWRNWSNPILTKKWLWSTTETRLTTTCFTSN